MSSGEYSIPIGEGEPALTPLCTMRAAAIQAMNPTDVFIVKGWIRRETNYATTRSDGIDKRQEISPLNHGLKTLNCIPYGFRWFLYHFLSVIAAVITTFGAPNLRRERLLVQSFP
jgi:hypothetical protein